METIIKLLMEISVTSAVLIAAVLLIRRAFAKSMSPAVMLVLWGMVLIRLMLPVTFASPLHIGELFPEKQAIQEDATNADAPDTAVSTYAAQDSTSNSVGTYANNDFGETSALETETAAVQPEKSALTLDEILKKIPIWHVLMVVWVAGVAAVLAYSLKKAASFGRKLRFCKSVTDKELLRMVTHYKKTAGMRRRITVLECDIVQVPAVFGYINPKILVPSGFLYDIDSKTLGAILLHELLHIRFNDILISYIWLAAKAFHWFNPLVWLAYKRYADDVEIMRDRKAVQSLKEGGALEYSRSLLEAAKHANEKVKAPAAATALFEDKHRLRQRIVCIVKPRKKKKAYAVITAVLALILAVSCFTTACQPTPERKVVVGRQEDALENVQTIAPDDFKQIDAPEHINEVYDDFTYVKISYDSDVVVPEATAYPVTEVSKKVFSEEEVLSYIDLFTDGDYEMYAGWGETKDDYLRLLTKAKQYEGTERVTDDIIERLQKLYEKATNDIVNLKIESISQLPENISLNIKNEAGVISSFGGWNENSFGYNRDKSINALPEHMTDDSQYVKNMDGPYEYFAWKKPGEPDISQRDALSIALECKEALGADLDLYSVQPCSFIKDYVDKTTGWQFLFTRTISGLQTIDTIGTLAWRKETAPSYGSPWGEEQLIVRIDKEGLYSFWWKGASQIRGTEAQSAKLLDFATIQQRITDQLRYNYAYTGELEDINFEIEITKISLGISLISLENQTDTGVYVPTWYVDYRYKLDDQAEYEWESQQIMLNAVDGSYIEPRITVDDLMGNMDIGGSMTGSDVSYPQ